MVEGTAFVVVCTNPAGRLSISLSITLGDVVQYRLEEFPALVGKKASAKLALMIGD